MEDSRTTLDQILAKENMEKKGDNRQNFDASQVKINPAIMEELDNAHKILDQIISTPSVWGVHLVVKARIGRRKEVRDQMGKRYIPRGQDRINGGNCW